MGMSKVSVILSQQFHFLEIVAYVPLFTSTFSPQTVISAFLHHEGILKASVNSSSPFAFCTKMLTVFLTGYSVSTLRKNSVPLGVLHVVVPGT